MVYYTRTGRLLRVRRGLYAVVPPGSEAGSFPVDLYLVAAKLTPDAVLSYHTALEFHGQAFSVQKRFTYSSDRPPNPFSFRSHFFRGVKFPSALCLAGAEQFGVQSANRGGLGTRVASLERTLVDVLDRPDLTGGWEEVWRSLESVAFFDLDKVVKYALLLKNATTAAKVGFYLEQHGDSLMVESRHLEPLRNVRPRQPHYLDRSRRQSGRLVTPWNLVIPIEVIERQWGEVV